VWRVRYTMPGMCSAETTSYIAHHLQLVGRPDQLFTEDALSLIHNNLALQSLVAAFATGKNLVGDASARAAVSEVVD
jgi:type II secretory pathway predicted ATPase ExeA